MLACTLYSLYMSNELASTQTVECKTCGKQIDELDVFPKGNCLACHAAIWDRLPPRRPDFIGAIVGLKTRKTR